MTDDEIRERVNRVLVEEFELEEDDITPEAKLMDDLGLDSLDSVDLVVALEKAFDFKIDRAVDEEKIREIRIVGDIFDFVKSKRDAA